MTPEQKQQIHERAILRMTEAFNTGETKIVDELLVPGTGSVERTPMPGTSTDRFGLKMKIRHIRAAFPDATFTIEEMTFEGDTVMFRWRLVGTHSGRFLDKEPTNKRAEFSGRDVVVFRDGKIVDHHSTDNKGGMIERIGG